MLEEGGAGTEGVGTRRTFCGGGEGELSDVKCPRCGKEMDLYEKDTSSGRDMRTYVCRLCDKWEDVDNGVALWKVLHDAREKDEKDIESKG